MSHVVCIGAATQDTIFRVPRHPEPDDLVVATDFAVAGGGPAATAAVALARHGVQVHLVAAVGDDAVGKEIRGGLEREGVDVSCVRVVSGARSWQSTIAVGDGTRAIVTMPGPPVELDERAQQLCRDAEWVHVDHAGYAAAPRDVRLSVDGGNPIPELELEGVALYAPTERALRELYPDISVEEAARAAVFDGAELVVVTRGADGSLAVTAEDLIDAPATPVDAVSTLGAGDVFHGALLAYLVRGEPLPVALGLANEAAALSCRALDGRSAIPTLA